MSTERLFLSARWQDLILLNYAVPDALLVPLLPAGLELDRYRGSAFVSLVAFDFLDTRVMGVRWPGYTNFAEINLRFYVRRGEQRGVCFIREIVPQRVTALLARALYNEPYRAAPIVSTAERTATTVRKAFVLRWQGREHRIAAEAAASTHRPPSQSLEHWFKEHEWGFGRSRAGATMVYRVEHPEWDVYDGARLDVAFDFGQVYGAAWGDLSRRRPDSMAFAVGSAIKVFGMRGV